jgi:hypothetical protein
MVGMGLLIETKMVMDLVFRSGSARLIMAADAPPKSSLDVLVQIFSSVGSRSHPRSMEPWVPKNRGRTVTQGASILNLSSLYTVRR